MKAIARLIAVFLFAAIGGSAHAVDSVDDAQVKRGEYLALAGDCVVCHSVPGGEPFADGLRLPTPIGDIIVTLGNFLSQRYGNPAATVSVDQVKALRAEKLPGGGMDLVLLARLGLTVGVIGVLCVTWWLFSRRKRREA